MPLSNISNDDFGKLVKFIHGHYGIDLSQKRQLVTSRLTGWPEPPRTLSGKWKYYTAPRRWSSLRFIHGHYGIDLSQKRQLVTSRLSSLLSQKGYADFGPFVSDLLKKQDPADMELVLNRLTTNYTFFMREQEHFDFFQHTILPDLVTPPLAGYSCISRPQSRISRVLPSGKEHMPEISFWGFWVGMGRMESATMSEDDMPVAEDLSNEIQTTKYLICISDGLLYGIP